MADGRRNNGNKGHSTKAKGKDKRKNEWKEAIENAGSIEKLTQVLDMLYDKSIEKQDTKAASIYLAYYLGKPVETKDVNLSGDIPLFDL